MKRVGFPELFLGLLAVAVAVVLTAHSISGTIRDRQHLHDTISVTGSARKPITANLVRWSLTVHETAPDAARGARLLRSDIVDVQAFLRRAGVP
ncbi:MAG TPA: SIMPL domain-containing protein, partial [Gaiellaceae bacterium]